MVTATAFIAERRSRIRRSSWSADGHIVAASIGKDVSYRVGSFVGDRKITSIRYYNSDDRDVAHVDPCYLLYGRDYRVLEVLRGKPIATYYRPVEYF